MELQPLWWPPGKVAGAYLGPFLARHGIGDAIGWPEREGLRVDVDLSERLEDMSGATYRINRPNQAPTPIAPCTNCSYRFGAVDWETCGGNAAGPVLPPTDPAGGGGAPTP